MLDALVSFSELALFLITVVWVGKRPTAVKVSLMIAAVCILEFGSLASIAAQNGCTPSEWYIQSFNELIAQTTGQTTAVQQQEFTQYQGYVAHLLPGCYAVISAAYVFIALCIRWVIDRIRHKSQWAPFSKVDLNVFWVLPLIVGIVVYTVSLVPGVPQAQTVGLVGANVLVMSVIPLFVQGAAAGKGIMNRQGLDFAWQLVIGFFGVVSGLLFVIWPLLGLFDFWANFRKLPRDDSSQGDRK